VTKSISDFGIPFAFPRLALKFRVHVQGQAHFSHHRPHCRRVRYLGSHGDLRMSGPKPGNGPAGLKQYDPEAYALMDDLYGGRITIAKSTRQRTRDE